MDEQRRSLVQQYIVFHLKLIEFLHLSLLSTQLLNTGRGPDNLLGHGADRFRETLLGATVSAFIAINDDDRRSTNARRIFCALYPNSKADIERVWGNKITPGETIMRNYRHKAGAHGDALPGYLNAKLGIFAKKAIVIEALLAFTNLAMELLRKQEQEQPYLAQDIEEVLSHEHNRREMNPQWLREMLLIAR